MRITAASTLLVFLALQSPAADTPSTPANDPVSISRAWRQRGEYGKAEQVLRQGLAENSGAANSHLQTLLALADLLREEGSGAESRRLFLEALNNAPDWNIRFNALLGLADLDREAGSWKLSIDEWNQAMAIAAERGFHTLEAFALRGLGDTWLAQGNTARAEPLLRRALSIMESDSRVTPERMAGALDSMATLYRFENKLALAEELWLRQLKMETSHLGENHPQVAIIMGHLADVWSAQGYYDRARDSVRKSTEIFSAIFAKDSAAVACTLAVSGLVEQRADNLKAAADNYAKALDMFRKQGPDGERLTERVARQYAAVLVRLHRGREAKVLMDEVKSFHAR